MSLRKILYSAETFSFAILKNSGNIIYFSFFQYQFFKIMIDNYMDKLNYVFISL